MNIWILLPNSYDR